MCPCIGEDRERGKQKQGRLNGEKQRDRHRVKNTLFGDIGKNGKAKIEREMPLYKQKILNEKKETEIELKNIFFQGTGKETKT